MHKHDTFSIGFNPYNFGMHACMLSMYGLSCRDDGDVLMHMHISCMANVLRGETFAVVHKTQYSLENFYSASGQGHCILYTENDSRGETFAVG